MLLAGRELSRGDLLRLVGDISQLASITPLVHDDGVERGVRTLRVSVHGCPDFEILLDRGLDIGATYWRGESVSWRTPRGFASPAYTEPEGAGWTRTFGGGLLTTCGLMNIGPAGIDRGEALGLHGRISHIPAENVSRRIGWDGDELVAVVEGRVVETSLGGPTLELRRQISARTGSPEIRIHDTVTNVGSLPASHLFRYHLNLGFPYVRPGDTIVTPGTLVGTRVDAPILSEPWQTLSYPEADRPEEVFYVRAENAADTESVAISRGRGSSRAPIFTAEWSVATLPVLVVWKHQLDRVNVVALEPSSARDEGRSAARANGELAMLHPDDSREYRLRLSFADPAADSISVPLGAHVTQSEGETTMTSLAETLEAAIGEHGGLLRLDPALVARDWLPAGRRLGLADDQYDVGERGTICERWLASTTHADNTVGPADEGISDILMDDGTRLNLATAVHEGAPQILGADYAATHDGLGRLAKLYDFAARIPYHIHPPLDQAKKVGRNSKDEAYYFPPGVDMGAHPETFFGFHPWIARERAGDLILNELKSWDSDEILRLSRAYKQMPEDGFFLPSGILHAPGTALTIELQEDSDTLAMFQALNAGKIISKELLFKDISAEDRETRGEAAALDWLDWEANGDPYFYENHHIAPKSFTGGDGFDEAWIFYGSPKFSGKRLKLAPGAHYTSMERGVFSIFVWWGTGSIGGVAVSGNVPGSDELLVVHSRAVQPLEYVNEGTEDMIVIKFFGPDINPDAPAIPLTAA